MQIDTMNSPMQLTGAYVNAQCEIENYVSYMVQNILWGKEIITTDHHIALGWGVFSKIICEILFISLLVYVKLDIKDFISHPIEAHIERFGFSLCVLLGSIHYRYIVPCLRHGIGLKHSG